MSYRPKKREPYPVPHRISDAENKALFESLNRNFQIRVYEHVTHCPNDGTRLVGDGMICRYKDTKGKEIFEQMARCPAPDCNYLVFRKASNERIRISKLGDKRIVGANLEQTLISSFI